MKTVNSLSHSECWMTSLRNFKQSSYPLSNCDVFHNSSTSELMNPKSNSVVQIKEHSTIEVNCAIFT